MDVKKIGRFIAFNRKRKGLTQEQLGEKLGVSNKTVSRWENGNYMPDLSLLEPLSNELGITLNELLAGEAIEKEKVVECSEQNLISTIDYSVKKIKDEHKKISIFIMIAGVLLSICAFTICAPESSWSSVYSIVGLLVFIIGLFRELKIASTLKKLFISAGVFVLVLMFFFGIDYIGVTTSRRPPIYRYITETHLGSTKIIVYRNPFYNVYRINTDTLNEYYVIDTEKKYSIDTVPVSPFDREKSGIENIVKYQNSYIGDNSNTGALIGSLPLSEYGYVFEIDSQDCGLTIDYHFTDWYVNENLYVEKSMIYNSVAIFALIDNVQYINYNFSGSAYRITREEIEKKYPDFDKIIGKSGIDEEGFNQYVEQKMNDDSFVESVFSLWDKVDVN